VFQLFFFPEAEDSLHFLKPEEKLGNKGEGTRTLLPCIAKEVLKAPGTMFG
jgi:hypothetical protein